jgi:hypothetical protein
MRIVDDGNRLVIASPAPRLFRWGAWLFAGLSVVYVIIVVVSLASAKDVGAVDCDRARGTCEVTTHGWSKSAPIADLSAALLHHAHSTRNSSASDVAALVFRDGHELAFGEPAYHDEPGAAYRALVAGMNAFLADPSLPRYRATYVARDDDWFYIIFFAFVSPLFAFFLSRLAVGARVELDRAARSVRSELWRLWRRPIATTVRFDEVSGIAVTEAGRNWVTIYLRTASRPLYVARLPRTVGGQEKQRQLVAKLGDLLGVPSAQGQ